MVIPDWFYNLMTGLGLIDSEEKKLRKKIAANEESRRNLNHELDLYIKRIRNLEAQIKVLRPEYESAHGAEKNIISAKIKPLLQELEQMKEKERLTSLNIKNLTDIIHTDELQLQQLQNPDIIEDLEDTIDKKKDIVYDMREQTRASEKLESVKLPGEENESPDFSESDFSADVSDIDNYFKSMDEEKTKDVPEEA